MNNQFEMIGKRIKQRRTELKIKQNTLADMVHVSNNHLSAVECGRERPSLETILNICHELNTTPDFILLGNMHPNDVPQNIADSIRLCNPEDQKLARDFIELLIERRPPKK